MRATTVTIRKAGADDILAIRALQERSLRVLGSGHYAPDELAAFVGQFGTMDFGIVDEGHFFLATDSIGTFAGTGGWSQRRPGYLRGEGADAAPGTATVRGVFVNPTATRMGIGSAVMRHIEADAASHGMRSLGLTATFSGVALYEALGYRERGRRAIGLGSGLSFGCVDMEKELPACDAATSPSLTGERPPPRLSS